MDSKPEKWAIFGRSTPKTLKQDMQKQVRTLTSQRQAAKPLFDKDDEIAKETVYALSKKDLLSRLKRVFG